MNRNSSSNSDTPENSAKAKRAVLVDLLEKLYSIDDAQHTADRLLECIDRRATSVTSASSAASNSALLITYADTITKDDSQPLTALGDFLRAQVQNAFGRLHLLPFFPASSDDGFAVVDYQRVDHHTGDWGHIESLAQEFDLMVDLVINHCSREHLWFADFVSGKTPGKDYFITLPEEVDVSAVTRPRSSPLITSVSTYAGIRHVWTTFSADQVDLDFGNPDVLVEFIEILLFYIERGARIIRLDAVAFLWKRLGTSCMSLAETHVVVKLLRALVDMISYDVLLITETNVPHQENISYYGNGDEAHAVYQFSLAPLMLYTYTFGNSDVLVNWADQLQAPPAGCSALNFLSSHDGIGLRPLEGLISDAEVDRLVAKMQQRGGFVSLRDAGDSGRRPYEINITLFSAFGGGSEQLPAYLGAHALLFAFQGIPAVYIHSLLASLNDIAKVEETGRTRSINRGTLSYDALEAELADVEGVRHQSLAFISEALLRRQRQPAFALDAPQRMLKVGAGVIAFERVCQAQTILVVASVVDQPQRLPLDKLGIEAGHFHDHLHEVDVAVTDELLLQPFAVCWLDTSHHTA